MMHGRAVGIMVVALALAAPAAARAENGWEAKWLGQSESPTLESGETVTSFLIVRNVGQKTWTPGNTLLGVSNPRDRESPFVVAGSWRGPNRIVPIDRELAPGAEGRFTFPMRAPDVASTTVFDEYFEPVADDPADPGWMGNTGEWNGVFLRYTVLAPQNPSVSFNSAPFTVDRGQPIDLSASATDNRAVTRVAFSIRGRAGAVEATPGPNNSYTGRLDSAPLPAGTYVVVARAEDSVGRASEATTNVMVREPAPEPPPSTPPSDPPASPPPTDRSGAPAWRVRVRAGWTYRGRRTQVRTLTVSGLEADATVAVRCSGRGCAFRSRKVKTGGKSLVRLASRFKRRRLRSGTRIVLTVARPDQGARSYTFRTRTNRLPSVRESCRAPDGKGVDCGR